MVRVVPRASDFEDLGQGAGTLIGPIFFLLAFLILLRHFVVVLIDYCFLAEGTTSIPFLSFFNRYVLLRRRQPQQQQQQQQQRNDVDDEEEGENNDDELDESRPIMSILRGISSLERDKVIQIVLPSKVVTDNTILLWKQQQQQRAEISNSKTGIACDDNNDDNDNEGETETKFICAICLGDLAVDEHFITPPSCNHTFHQSCILEWVTKSVACPCCRMDMITEDALDKVLLTIGHAKHQNDSNSNNNNDDDDDEGINNVVP